MASKGSGREILEGCRKVDLAVFNTAPNSAYCTWKLLLDAICFKNAEISFKNCVKFFDFIEKSGAVVDFNLMIRDLSDALIFLNITEGDSLSDETWLSICTLVKKCLLFPSHILSGFMDLSLLPVLAHLFAHFVGLIRSRRSNRVRLVALSVVDCVIQHFDKGSSGIDVNTFALKSSYLTKMFPGISQAFLTAVIEQICQSSKLKSKVFHVWADLIVSCFGDESMKCVENLDLMSVEKMRLSDFSSTVSIAISHLCKILPLCVQTILSEPVIYSVSARERLYVALTHFSTNLLKNCWKLLNLNATAQALRDELLCCLVIVNADERCSSYNKSSEFIAELSSMIFPLPNNEWYGGEITIGLKGQEVIGGLARQILVDSCHVLLESLQKCLDENIVKSLVDRMYNIIKFLGVDGVNRFIQNPANLEMCLITFCKYLQLDESMFRFTVKENSTPLKTHPSVQLFKKYFVHFRNPAFLYRILEMFQLMSITHRNFDLLCRFILDIMASDTCLQASGLQLLSACFCGLSKCEEISKEEAAACTIVFLDNLREYDFLRLHSDQGNVTMTHWPPVGHSEASINIESSESVVQGRRAKCLNACIFMELIATSSLVWYSGDGVTEVYPDELQDFIHCMFSLAAGDGLVATTAQHALLRISQYCHFARIDDFVLAAAGPILSSLSIEFHTVLQSIPVDDAGFPVAPLYAKLQSACSALSYLVEHANSQVIQGIQPLIMQVLLCLDLSYNFAAAVFLPVLRKVVALCLRTEGSKVVGSTPSTVQVVTTSPDSKISIVDRLVNRSNDKVVVSRCMEQALKATKELLEKTRKQHSHIFRSLAAQDKGPYDSASEGVTAISESNGKNPVVETPNIRLVEEILLRSIHLMSRESARIKVSSMDLLNDGCALITSEDVLLPLVHKIWSPLLARMHDRQPVVVEKAFELFATLTSVAGSFIRARATSDLIAPLVTFLERGASESAGATSAYQFLTACRVQRRLLEAIGTICLELKLFSNTLQPLVKILFTYSQEDQPLILQEAAAKSLLRLCELDPGVVMLGLTQKMHE